jgi:choline dehydrogenase-like flavoprotein
MAENTTRRLASGVTSDPSKAANNTFDYIIVGGGLTGLAVASRLSEDPQTTVLVIETGDDDRSNPLVYDIYTYGQAYGTSLDWYWPSENNKNISGYVLG